ncbi:MAG: DUF309 domain-containing protein [Polyangia bacterium]
MSLDLSLVHAGRDAFNRGDWFDAHELWERVWLVAAPPEKTYLQGLIQVCAALLKLEKHRVDLHAALLARAMNKLASAPGSFAGMDVGGLRDVLARGLPFGLLRL